MFTAVLRLSIFTQRHYITVVFPKVKVEHLMNSYMVYNTSIKSYSRL